jgi:hypothetical protein
MTISIIEDRGGAPPPDLTDDKWDHGSGDGEVFTVVKKGVLLTTSWRDGKDGLRTTRSGRSTT